MNGFRNGPNPEDSRKSRILRFRVSKSPFQEFQFLKESSDAFDDDDAHVHHLTDHIGLGEQLDFVLLTPDTDNPFCTPQRKSVSSDKTIENEGGSMSRSSSEDSYIESYSQALQSTPNLCNTALNLLRFFGRYIRMTSLLHSVADEAITAIIQLFEYFAYSIFNFFAKDLITEHFEVTTFTSLHLRRLMEAIKIRLILENEANEEFKQVCFEPETLPNQRGCLCPGSPRGLEKLRYIYIYI